MLLLKSTVTGSEVGTWAGTTTFVFLCILLVFGTAAAEAAVGVGTEDVGTARHIQSEAPSARAWHPAANVAAAAGDSDSSRRPKTTGPKNAPARVYVKCF
jgi:hypothetical protein